MAQVVDWHVFHRVVPPDHLTSFGIWLWKWWPRFDVAFFPHRKYSREWLEGIKKPGSHFAYMYPPARRWGTEIRFRVWGNGPPYGSYSKRRFTVMFWVPFNIKTGWE